MKGNEPNYWRINDLNKINELGLYNDGNDLIEFKVGSRVGLTITLTKELEIWIGMYFLLQIY